MLKTPFLCSEKSSSVKMHTRPDRKLLNCKCFIVIRGMKLSLLDNELAHAVYHPKILPVKYYVSVLSECLMEVKMRVNSSIRMITFQFIRRTKSRQDRKNFVSMCSLGKVKSKQFEKV